MSSISCTGKYDMILLHLLLLLHYYDMILLHFLPFRTCSLSAKQGTTNERYSTRPPPENTYMPDVRQSNMPGD